MRRRAPVPVSAAVERLASALAPATPLAAVQRVWEDAAGPVFAAQTEVVAERGGIVTVRCSGGVWANELTLLAPQVVAKLNELLGEPRVTGLRCTAGAGRRSRT